MSSRSGEASGPFRTDSFDRSAVAAVGLITLFTVALATSQLTAAKVLALPLQIGRAHV